jgi:hypothetical protein
MTRQQMSKEKRLFRYGRIDFQFPGVWLGDWINGKWRRWNVLFFASSENVYPLSRAEFARFLAWKMANPLKPHDKAQHFSYLLR